MIKETSSPFHDGWYDVYLYKDMDVIDKLRRLDWDDWLAEHCVKEEWRYFSTFKPEYHIFYFKNREDAIIFKLTFGGL